MARLQPRRKCHIRNVALATEGSFHSTSAFFSTLFSPWDLLSYRLTRAYVRRTTVQCDATRYTCPYYIM